NTRTNTNHNRSPPDSRTTTPRKPGQITVSAKPGSDQLERVGATTSSSTRLPPYRNAPRPGRRALAWAPLPPASLLLLPTPLPPIPLARLSLTSSPPARPLAVAGPERPGKLLRPRQRLRTPGDGDLRGLAQERPVLGQEFSRHRELGGAQVGIRRKRRELALGKLQFKGVEGHIRSGLEGARGDAVLDERRADQLDCDAIALEHHRQVGERFAPVRYEVGGTG